MSDNIIRTPGKYDGEQGYIAHVITKEGGYNYHAPRSYAVNPTCQTEAEARALLDIAMGGPSVVAGYIEHYWQDDRGRAYGMHREMTMALTRAHKVYSKGGAPTRIHEMGEPAESTWRDLYNLEPLSREAK